MAFFKYNVNSVFIGKFIYFFLLFVATFVGLIVIHLFGRGGAPDAQAIYGYLLISGMLMVFYPTAYAIQRDSDVRMIETLFGIPDYRYKVWLVRLFVLFLVITVCVSGLILFSRVGLADFSSASMLFHVMIPIIFFGSLAFSMATLLRSGNGTAVILVIVILFFWFAGSTLRESAWNLFHNPFRNVDEIQTLIWSKTTFYNRIYLIIGSFISILFGLFRLQKREKFI